VLSYSRDPFCCYTTSMNAATWWDCHRRAFAHFGGVPAAIVYDRTKTIVKRHVRPGLAVPLSTDAAAFAEHYGFAIDVLAAYRPTGKGRVERQVRIVRDHVTAGRGFASIAELDGAFAAWVPMRRAQVHRTHGEVIGVRAVTDQAALIGLPAVPYLVCDRHLRRVGKDCLVSFEGSLYSVPAIRVRPRQIVEVRLGVDSVAIHAQPGDAGRSSTLLSVHSRAAKPGTWVTDPTHWDGLPDGHTRATTADPAAPADSVMEPGPSTVRPDTPAPELLARLAERDLRTAIVTTPAGRLLGVFDRSDAERVGRGRAGDGTPRWVQVDLAIPSP